jgi:hypothetical protein
MEFKNYFMIFGWFFSDHRPVKVEIIESSIIFKSREHFFIHELEFIFMCLRFKDLQEFGNIVDDTKCSFLPNLIESNF